MGELKIEWGEGPHGVTSVVFIGDEGSLTFAPNASTGAGTMQKPFDRASALSVVSFLAEAILKRLVEGHDVYRP